MIPEQILVALPLCLVAWHKRFTYDRFGQWAMAALLSVYMSIVVEH